MGNKKKGYNWKSRQVVDTVIDNTETKKVGLLVQVLYTSPNSIIVFITDRT